MHIRHDTDIDIEYIIQRVPVSLEEEFQAVPFRCHSDKL